MKNAFRIVLINLAFLLVGLAALELVFGSWLRPNTLNRLNISKNYQRTFDIEELYDWKEPTSKYTRDEFGLRGDFSSPGEIDILTVGGSTTDQIYVADGYTWQDVLQQAFAESGRRIVVANAGIDGQSTYGHIKNFDWWFPNIPGLKPRYVLFYIGINDFYRDDDNRYDGLMRNQDGVIAKAVRERSALYHLIRTAKGVYRAQFVDRIGHQATAFDDVEWTDQPPLKNHRPLMEGRMRAYRQRLETLIDRTLDFGATPILVTQPSRNYKSVEGRPWGLSTVNNYEGVEYNGVDYRAMIGILDGVTMATCLQKDAICIDMAADLAADLEDDDFYDPYHMTPKGARKVGLYLHDKLEAQVR